MTRIDRYVLHRLFGAFGLASLVLVLVYWVNRAVILFDQLIADGQSAWVFLEFTALALPSIVRIVLPLAAFAATLWGVNRLAGDSELAVLQATGASPWRLARPALLFGLMVGALVAALSHVLGPASLHRLNAREAEIAGTATARLLRAGEFVSPLPGLTIYVREVTDAGELRGLLLSDSRDARGSEGLSTLTTAATAYLVRAPTGPQLVMLDGQIQRLDRAARRLAVTSFGDLAYDLGPLLPDGNQGGRSVGEVGTVELMRASPALQAETGRTGETLRARGHMRIAEALLAPAAALIAAASLMVAPFSRLGAWPQVGLAVGLAIATKLAESRANAALSAAPAMWPLAYLPSLAGMGAAALMLWWAARPRLVCQAGGGRRAPA